jgi:hypothetical protein
MKCGHPTERRAENSTETVENLSKSAGYAAVTVQIAEDFSDLHCVGARVFSIDSLADERLNTQTDR